MKSWKFKYFEKNNKESHIHIFSSLEIKNYLKKFLNDYNHTLNDYQINFSNSTVQIFISIYKKKKIKKKEKKKKTIKTLITLLKKNNIKQTQNIINLKIYKTLKPKEQYKTLKPYLNSNNNIYKKKLKLMTTKTFKLNSFSKKLLEGIKIFLKNKYNIILTIHKVKRASKSDLKDNNIKLKLRRFTRADFFAQGTSILFTFISQINSEKILIKFIAKELALTKQHKFFLNFLKEGFNTLINQNFSKISGIKLIVSGRLNNVMRAKPYAIKIGKIPLIAPCPNLTYSETTAYSKNGTLGIKLWVLKKL